jgi:hypothetical protein
MFKENSGCAIAGLTIKFWVILFLVSVFHHIEQLGVLPFLNHRRNDIWAQGRGD